MFRDERDESYLYHSKAFDSCDTSEQVLAAANEELAVLSGVLRYVRDSHQPLATGAVHKRHTSGRRDIFVHIRAALQIRAEVGEVSVTVRDAAGNIIQKPSPLPRTVTTSSLANKDPSVSKAMRLFAAMDAKTWVGLYRLHEVIEADVGGEYALRQKNWGADLKRFKRSANSVHVAGDAARHGREYETPPSAPMTLDEAIAYVNYVMHAWLATKGV